MVSGRNSRLEKRVRLDYAGPVVHRETVALHPKNRESQVQSFEQEMMRTGVHSQEISQATW